MFGKTEIIGEKNISLGEKNRIVLPGFTKAEPQDIVIPQFNYYKTILSLYSSNEFFEKSEKLEEELSIKKLEGKITNSDILRLKRYYYGILTFQSETIDKQRRIILDNRIIKELKIEKQLFVIGVEHHLELCRDKETYMHEKEKTYKK